MVRFFEQREPTPTVWKAPSCDALKNINMTAEALKYVAAPLYWKVFPCHHIVGAPDGGLECSCAAYVRSQVELFPDYKYQACLLPKAGKKPSTPDGLLDATRDPALLTKLLRMRKYKGSNIGAPCGPENGFWVVDFDFGKNDEGIDVAREYYDALIAEHSDEFTNTVTCLTGRGGIHLYYAWDDNWEIANTGSMIAGKVDIRGAGGYVILPPSAHWTGTRAAWKAGKSPWEMDPAPAPQWLLEAAFYASAKNQTADKKSGVPRSTRPIDPDDPFSNLDNVLPREADTYGWENIIANDIGDHAGAHGYDQPTYRAACVYFMKFGPSADATELHDAVAAHIEAIASAERKAEYFAGGKLDKRIEDGRKFARAKYAERAAEGNPAEGELGVQPPLSTEAVDKLIAAIDDDTTWEAIADICAAIGRLGLAPIPREGKINDLKRKRKNIPIGLMRKEADRHQAPVCLGLDKEAQKESHEIFEKVSAALMASHGIKFEFPPKDFGEYYLAYWDEVPWLFSADGGRLCTPFVMNSVGVMPDMENKRGYCIHVYDEYDKWVIVNVENSGVIGAKETAYLKPLREQGFYITPDPGIEWFHSFLASAKLKGPTIYHTGGEHQGFFLLPSGERIPLTAEAKQQKYLPELAEERRMACEPRGGTAAEQIKLFHDICHFKGKNHFWTGILTGLMGVVGHLIDEDMAVISYEGPSTGGKSTAQGIAASHFGDPKLGAGLFISGKATENYYEVPLQRSAGTCVCFDETRLMKDANALQNLIFMIQQGEGKGRLDTKGNERQKKKWKGGVTILSNEVSLAQRLRQEGITLAGGTGARSLSISVEDTIDLNPDQLATILRYKTVFGHTGPLFIEALVKQGYAADRELLRTAVDNFAAAMTKTGDALQRRAVRLVALMGVAGEIAQKAGMIPADFDVKKHCQSIWDESLKSDGGAHKAIEGAVNNFFGNALEDFNKGIITFAKWKADRTQVCKGWYDLKVPVHTKTMRRARSAGQGVVLVDVWVFSNRRFTEYTEGAVSDDAVRKRLNDMNVLVKPFEEERLAWKGFPDIGKIPCTVILASAFTAEVVEKQAAPHLHVVK